MLVIRPDRQKYGNMLNVELQRLTTQIPKVVNAGIPNVSLAVIADDDAKNVAIFRLCVEGSGLRAAMAL